MDIDNVTFSNSHHSLRILCGYHSYQDVAFNQKSNIQLEQELRDLKLHYTKKTTNNQQEVLNTLVVERFLASKHSTNIYNDIYAKHITYLLKKLNSKEIYKSLDIIKDKDFTSVLDVLLGLGNLENKDLLMTFGTDKQLVLKQIIVSLLTEINYSIDCIYKQQVLTYNTSNSTTPKSEQWFPVAKYTNMLINSNYTDMAKDVFMNPDFLSPKEKQKKLFLDGFGYMTGLNGTTKLPFLMYATCCDCKENSVISIGGLTVFSEDLEDEMLEDIYINSGDTCLPSYFEKKILNNPNYVPNNDLYLVNTVTNTVTKLKSSGDVPSNLLKPTVTNLNSKYVFINGGIQINRKLVPVDGENSNKIFLKQDISYNTNSYLLNTETGHYTLILEQTTANNIAAPTRVGHTHLLLKDKSLAHFETGYLNYLQKVNSPGNTSPSLMSEEKLSIQNFLDNTYDDETSVDTRQNSNSSALFDEDEIVGEDLGEQIKLVRWNILLFGGYDYNLEQMDGSISPTNDMYLIRIYLYKDMNTNVNATKTALSPTMFVKKIAMDEKLTGTLPAPTAFHSSTLIPPGNMDKEVENPCSKAGKKLDEMVHAFMKNKKTFDKYLNAVRNQDRRGNRMLLNDIKGNVLESRGLNSSSDEASHSLMIHGGYNEKEGMHDAFLFFNFLKFQWEEKKVTAPLSLEWQENDNNDPLYTHQSTNVEIHIRISNHHFFLKGKYLICVGGMLSTSQKKDYARKISRKIPVTVIHLPTMEIKDVVAVNPEKEFLGTRSYMLGYDGDVIQCSNGELFICSGVGHILYDKEDVRKGKQVLVSDKNLVENDFFYDQIGLLGINMVYIPPTFTKLKL